MTQDQDPYDRFMGTHYGAPQQPDPDAFRPAYGWQPVTPTMPAQITSGGNALEVLADLIALGRSRTWSANQ